MNIIRTSCGFPLVTKTDRDKYRADCRWYKAYEKARRRERRQLILVKKGTS
jgi:hypothetical protein